MLGRLTARSKAPVEQRELPAWIAEHESDPALVKLVSEGGWRYTAIYYRAMFLKAKEREAEQQLEKARMEAKIAALEHQILGRKTEAGSQLNDGGAQEPEVCKRRRGAQKGHCYHRRQSHHRLPEIKSPVTLPGGVPVCAVCGKPYRVHSRQSQRIEYQVRIVRRVYEEQGAMRTCNCPEAELGQAPAVWASPPPNIIAKSPYDSSLWIEAILSKFYWYIPLARTLAIWASCGLELSPGVVVGGLARLAPLFDPVFGVIAAYQREQASRLQADETGWTVFGEPREQSGRSRWQMWVIRSAEAVVYLIKPSRAAEVLLEHLPENVVAILLVDRFSAYKKCARLLDGLVLAFCWAHVRRDFVEALRNYEEQIGKWAKEWIEAIAKLYQLEKARQGKLSSARQAQPQAALKALADSCAGREQQRLKSHLQNMEARRGRQLKEIQEKLARPQLEAGQHGSRAKARARLALGEQKRILESLGHHWEGLTLFVDYPDIPLDNNASERALRGAAVARKNYYGSGAGWSIELTAKLFSIFATLELFGINVRTWLGRYFELCAQNAGQAPGAQEIRKLMPWDMDQTTLESFSQPPPWNLVQNPIDTS